MFWRVTLPNIKWGLLYGVILCNARAMGEFGAVYVVSGHIAGKTDTMPLRVEKLYQEYNLPGCLRGGLAADAPGARDAGGEGGIERRVAQRATAACRRSSCRRGRMGIEVKGISQAFGRFVALNDVSFTVPHGELVALLGPSGSRQDHAAAHHRRARASPSAGSCCSTARTRRSGEPGERRRRLRLPALRALPPHDGVRERRLRPARAPARPAALGRGDSRRVHELLELVQLDYLGDRFPAPALGRPAAACRAGARPRRRAEGAAPRRAVRRARRQGPPGAAPLAAPAARTKSTSPACS